MWDAKLEKTARETVSWKVNQISVRARKRNKCLEKIQENSLMTDGGFQRTQWKGLEMGAGVTKASGILRNKQSLWECRSVRFWVMEDELASWECIQDWGVQEWEVWWADSGGVSERVEYSVIKVVTYCIWCLWWFLRWSGRTGGGRVEITPEGRCVLAWGLIGCQGD